MSTTPARPGDQTQTAGELATEWAADSRWNGIRRDYTADDVIALRGPVREDATLARRGAEDGL
jgi:isocitrate lyase